MDLRPVAILTCVLLTVAACEGDDAPPKPSPSPAVPAAVQEASTPSPRDSATPSPSATDTPSPDETLPTSTPGPIRREDGLIFYFGADVVDFDRSLIIRAVEVTRQLLRDESGVQPPAAVFAYESAEDLAEAFSQRALAQRWRGAEMAQRLPQTIAEASYRGIVINTGSEVWKDLDAAERLRVVAHEFVHVIQLEHAGLEVAEATFSGPNITAPPAGPFWLLEGSAEVVSWLVRQETTLGSYTEALSQYARESRGAETDLSRMEGYVGFAKAGRPGLGVSVLATDYLLRSNSLAGLFEFWTEIGRGASWESAFTRHFGLPPQYLYEAFAEYYEAVWRGSGN
jgi:hypothetical protein